MDSLAKVGYDVWAVDIHGYGHSDKTDKDWSGLQSAVADIAAAVEYITKIRAVGGSSTKF
jgi:pimeloyl-ACP methyl ester carboxylesterase